MHQPIIYNLGNLLKDQKRYDEAEGEYRDAIRVDPNYAAAHYNLGVLLDDLKRYDEAEKEWRDAIRADPDHASAHYKYRDAIRADPDYAKAHANLGILFLATERPEEAKKEFGIAKELFKNQGRDEDVKKIEELLPPT
jgi:tetratricopeptide (TPR) repeat protein